MDGVLRASGFGRLMTKLGLAETDEEARTMFEWLDVGSKGYVTEQQFVSKMGPQVAHALAFGKSAAHQARIQLALKTQLQSVKDKLVHLDVFDADACRDEAIAHTHADDLEASNKALAAQLAEYTAMLEAAMAELDDDDAGNDSLVGGMISDAGTRGGTGSTHSKRSVRDALAARPSTLRNGDDDDELDFDIDLSDPTSDELLGELSDDIELSDEVETERQGLGTWARQGFDDDRDYFVLYQKARGRIQALEDELLRLELENADLQLEVEQARMAKTEAEASAAAAASALSPTALEFAAEAAATDQDLVAAEEKLRESLAIEQDVGTELADAEASADRVLADLASQGLTPDSNSLIVAALKAQLAEVQTMNASDKAELASLSEAIAESNGLVKQQAEDMARLEALLAELDGRNRELDARNQVLEQRAQSLQHLEAAPDSASAAGVLAEQLQMRTAEAEARARAAEGSIAALERENVRLMTVLEGWNEESQVWKSTLATLTRENETLRGASVPRAEHDAVVTMANELVGEVSKLSEQLRLRDERRVSHDKP
ncbi:uncharacterized protein AMSG_04876 [Thecamonas trahens ATCC 50062]|uniref:EF-hand domain-containing protein n=1 Tax=Thecamonas trahens ATCC 50062 TaxID=461836 RepID=A0A0L0D7V2_THETB|nr:hypothetical protein AMSG_04876 [Thecamonas trahens ATCC 50062]KNC48429.1 hypothetical protein AMSG_04876 [Thecamonas trahens ATCC 50062]|eukprot:XP_013758544.1 hypothetical protein AMSG_04876 [Thecamonas trahens ATCC 50062]